MTDDWLQELVEFRNTLREALTQATEKACAKGREEAYLLLKERIVQLMDGGNGPVGELRDILAAGSARTTILGREESYLLMREDIKHLIWKLNVQLDLGGVGGI